MKPLSIVMYFNPLLIT